MLKKILFVSVALAVLTSLMAFTYFKANESPQLAEASVGGLYHEATRVVDDSSLRAIGGGSIVGFSDAYNTQAWLGLPYAKAPVRELRWRAPQPTDSWKEVYQATEHADPCVQYWGQLAGTEGKKGDVVGSEDCLYLNVWAPKTSNPAEAAQNKRPVMVWIHGGGNDSGTANTYQAHHLAGTQDVVVVLLNYRLGIMGWFSHSSIREEANNLEDASGNFGTLDIIAGLKWVQENIEQFGGDPSNVTIFGESAGGKNVFSMLASPLAAGLFHKAISQSGSADTTLLTLAEDFPEETRGKPISGLKNSSNVLLSLVLGQQHSGESLSEVRSEIESSRAAELLEAMRSEPAASLMKLAADNLGEVEEIRVARIVRDGHVIPKTSVLQRLSQPDTYNAVPLIVGTNRDENKLFMMGDDDLVENILGVFPRIKDEAKYQRISDYVSRNWKAGAVDEPAKLIAKHGASAVFAYRFDWDDSPDNVLADMPNLIGAAHGVEISFVFGDFIGGAPLGPLLNKANAPGREQLSMAMMGYWAEFAHTGSPGKGRSGTLPLWQQWQDQGDNLMVFDSPEDQGIGMAEIRDNVVDIKAQISADLEFASPSERCEAYAALFLHGYQASDYWDPAEYSQLNCEDFPAGIYRNG